MMRSLLLEIRCEFLSLLRMPRFSVPMLTIPAMFYVFFGIVAQHGRAGFPGSKYALCTTAVFGVMMVTLMSLGAGIAPERGLGWLEVKRASPMSRSGWLVAKLAGVLLFALAVTAELCVLGAAAGGVRVSALQWSEFAAMLVAGSVCFAGLGFVLGCLSAPNSAPAVVNLVAMPMALASGLFLPVQLLPEFLQHLAPVLPSYHLARIGHAILGVPVDGPVAGAAVPLAGFTVLFAGQAWLLWQRMDSKANG